MEGPFTLEETKQVLFSFDGCNVPSSELMTSFQECSETINSIFLRYGDVFETSLSSSQERNFLYNEKFQGDDQSYDLSLKRLYRGQSLSTSKFRSVFFSSSWYNFLSSFCCRIIVLCIMLDLIC